MRHPIGVVAATASGRTAAATLASAWPKEVRVFAADSVAEALREAFRACEAVVSFLAVGATVRILAPLLEHKTTDPAVVCVDESRRYAVPVLGGHHGANALAERVAGVLGCTPVVTTASDAVAVPGLDELADLMGWRIEPGSDLAGVGAALLSGEPVALSGDLTWPLPALPPNVTRVSTPEPGLPVIAVTDEDLAAGRGLVVYRPPSLVVGVGASRGASAEEVLETIDAALAEARLSPLSVRHLASVDAKADEAGLLAAAERRGWPVVCHPAEALARVETPNPSEVVRAAVGTPSVAEAAARYAGPGRPLGELVVPKRRSARANPMVTVAVARHRGRGRLAIVGLGPGARDLLTPRAVAELRRASVVVGLDQYVDQVRDLLRPGTEVVASGLGQEEERARTAVELARAGRAVALIGSGDAGVYAMASPALDLADEAIDVVGVPGVTAAAAAASLLGAPLGHDHAYISLSDLHTPWAAIERRIRAAAEGDFVVCFYNPRSRQRDWQLARAVEILAAHRPPKTPVGYVRNATREGERVVLTTLADFDPAEVDMYTVVLVGSSSTRIVAGRMVTPRGYRWS
ncbi:hypothetical protein TH66_16575 [Carbonactinospora thermoautotrophica]|uniref:Precorrin-3B C(17)-methyltransferase n=2 Tax=Carbonactinospora thermoautotrophica TaxID=1469144 RepID=A0A132MR88_9ACTN|nr:precorrin-3B C(17)-methyltransferase [Carbonactinospora thermoautotrophica]KWX00405.1 hypothetical protein TH66_16575 [Carbonactinospora thermoautotrophica]